jgi:hypothetical protein
MNLVPLLYIGFRLTPFILVCFFVLSSLFSSDIRGLLFLLFLLCNTFITFLFSQLFAPEHTIPDDKVSICNSATIGNNERFSKLPLNINTVAFTFAYLVSLATMTNRVIMIIPTIIFFSLLILAMIAWEITHGCSGLANIVISGTIGTTLGIAFAKLMDTYLKEFIFFGSISQVETCKRYNDEVFECSLE